ASFLSLFLQNENQARELASGLKSEGIPSAYWFDNNWHYARKWNHFKELKNDTSLFEEQRNLLPDWNTLDLSDSDEILKKTITIPISLKWTDEKAVEIAHKTLEILDNLKS